jgi:hypothetical protein
MPHLVVTAALVLATIASTAMCLRSMNRTPKSKDGWSEDEWARGRLRGFYRGAVWGLVGAATGLALVVMSWSALGALALFVPASPAAFGLVGAGLLRGGRLDPWYLRYQMDRVMQGLPPRKWWDPRLD